MALLLAGAGLLTGNGSLAETPKAKGSASEWQNGRKLAPMQRETYRLGAGTSVSLSANSTAEVQPKVKMAANLEGLAPSAYAAQLTTGRIDIVVDPKKRPANAVFIYGPRRTTVLVRAGKVSVVAGPTSLAVGVYEGKDAASVGIGSTWRHISAGYSFAVSAETPQGMESKLPVAPSRVMVDRPSLALEGSASAARAEWYPVPGATRYIVHVVNGETKTRKTLEATGPSVALRGLEPGRHELRIAAVDAMGLNGATSAPISVNVVGLQLPAGAFVSQGKVYLESQQQLVLTHVDGLEATYDAAPVYFKATNRVGLRGAHPTTLHLRLPGATERVSLELLPRDLRAQVEISPALARWPRDRVVVRIQLPKTLAGVASIQAIPSVSVNNRAVDVLWARTEQTLETVIPAPPSYPGPWVVRAEVVDQHGIVLGRNFLEIASMAGVYDEDIPREIHRLSTRSQANVGEPTVTSTGW